MILDADERRLIRILRYKLWYSVREQRAARHSVWCEGVLLDHKRHKRNKSEADFQSITRAGTVTVRLPVLRARAEP